MGRKNITIVLLLVILVAVISGGGVYLWQHNTETNNSSLQIDVPAQQEATDVAAVKEETTVQLPVKSDKEMISEAMATKYNKPVADADLTINENDSQYAQGLVKFAGEIAGGWWLAAKTSGDWVIVADGNGVVMCSDIAPYNFPTSMVPECWDETTQTNVTR